MGVCDTSNIEINILVYENEMFSLTAEFYFNKCALVNNNGGSKQAYIVMDIPHLQ